MDKKKTGSLIKAARIEKNYTQSELGDLLGVTNKAVSRWENGESFPDVGVLERLSLVLDIKIQDIVTGEAESKDEQAITGSVRFVNWTFPFMESILALCGSVSQSEGMIPSDGKISKGLCYISALVFGWTLSVTWTFIIMISNGVVPFGMELSSVGPFLNGQLIIAFFISIAILLFELYRLRKEATNIHWGYMISIATIYMAVLYGDMLHRLSSVNEIFRMLLLRTLLVMIELFLSLGVAARLKRKR